MPDLGPTPFGPTPKILIECPGCGHMNRPDTLAVCGRCWRRVTDIEQSILAVGPDALRAPIYERLRKAQT